MTVTDHEVIEQEIEAAEKSLAILSIFANHQNLDIANWRDFSDNAEQTYLGHFTNLKSFAEDYAERLGFLNGEHDLLVRYFDFEQWASTLFYAETVWEQNGHYFQSL